MTNTATATEVGFVHLHVHSSYSLLEGATMIATLAKMAAADGQPALALTDTNNMYGALEFSEKMAGAGVQPISGVQLSVDLDPEDDSPRPKTALAHLVLLAMNETGYGNLMKLVSHACLASAGDGHPAATLENLSLYNDGVIALTGGHSGPIDVALAGGAEDRARLRLERLKAIYPDRLYVELQRHGRDGEEQLESSLIKLANEFDLPVVATNEPFFAKPDDHEAHDVLLAVADGTVVSEQKRRKVTAQHSFKTRAEMMALFADRPEALMATVEIATRCSYRVGLRKPILPRFSEDAGFDENAELRRQAEVGLAARMAKTGPADGYSEQDYRDRLSFELSVIERMQYPGYFLIVADFIKWAKNQDISVGPGRGSGAGSVVAYALTITDVDPLRFGLLFERFLNPDRVSMPDFDIDFCQDRREEVIDYVKRRYGDDRVAQIITFGTLLARGVLNDAGRALAIPYSQVSKLSQLVPQNPAKPVSLENALKLEPKLQEACDEDPAIKHLLDVAQKLEGLHRHASTHAAGVVIGDRPLEELVALSVDPKTGMRVTQFNMKWVEQAGLVKFDFLGLKTLTTLTTAVNLLKKRGITVDLSDLPFDDPTTYQMLARGETLGVFQLEGAGMRKALVDMKADRIEDLIALVALYRPGPMENIPTYCQRKLGREEPVYLHPKMEPILAETHGIIVYQEQVMQVAQALSGYSLGEADLLRRAMGKKIKAEMDAQRDRFVQGAVANGMEEVVASEIFDLLAKFADYGFNKSHAAAYAIVAFQTAYMKANYPVEFMAACMQLDSHDKEKLADFRRDAERMGFKVEKPDVNKSGLAFDVTGDSIQYALTALKGVGRPAVEEIVSCRIIDGPFLDLADFARRVDPKMVNRRAIDSLIAAGCFDSFEENRARISAAVSSMVAIANRTKTMRAAGQGDLFGSGTVVVDDLQLPEVMPWSTIERLKKEHESVGVFLSGHPLDDFDRALRRMRLPTYSDFVRTVRSKGKWQAKVAAFVLDRSERITKTGNRMGIITLSDQGSQFEAVLFSEALEEFRDALEPGQALVLRLWGNLDGDEVKCRIDSVETLDVVASRQQMDLLIRLRDDLALPEVSQSIATRRTMKSNGTVTLAIHLDDHERDLEISMPGLYPVNQQVTDDLRASSLVLDAVMG
jgi:DNA polymerase-3 subunit alpha